MLGWTPIIEEPITSQTGLPRMQLPNQGPEKLDKAIQNVKVQTGYFRVQCKYALDKRGCRSPNPWTSRAPLSRTTRQAEDQLSNTPQHCRRLGKEGIRHRILHRARIKR